MSKKNSFLLFLFLSPWAMFSLSAQSDSVSTIVERILEFYLENNEIEDFDNNTAFERLYDFQNNPLNINTATAYRFMELFFLNPVEIQAIIDHRTEYGDFISLEELQTIEGLDMTKVKMLLPFTTVGNASENINIKDLLAAGRSQVFLKYKRILQDKAGYISNANNETKYAGDPNYLYARYRFDAGRRLKAGFTMEKDPGEAFFKQGNKNGFDFYSGYLYAEKVNHWVEQVALGDYTMSMGQGLILHNGFGFGKSAFVTSFKKNRNHLRQYSSVNENLYFRGLATSLRLADWASLTLAYSQKKIDGSLALDTIENEPEEFFSSLLQGGLHRTASEIANKGSITQQNIGAVLDLNYKNLNIGVNYLQYNFSSPLKRPEAPYRNFYFSGKDLMNISVDYDYRFKNINLFGEVAQSDNGGRAMTHNVLVALDKRVDFAVSYRDFDKDYQVLEANAFAEGSLPIDEKGYYVGAEFRPNNEWKLSAYHDLWKHEWLRYRIDAPSSGKEYFLRLEYNKKRKFNAYILYRYEQKQRNSSLNVEKIDPLTDFIVQKFRVHFSQKINKDIDVKARTEFSFAQSDGIKSNGVLMFADLSYKPMGKSFDIIARYAIFDAANFDTRIYMFENDLLYEYSIPFFQNRGKRMYLIYKQKLSRRMTLEAKYAHTVFDNVDVISSGNEKIDGNVRSELKVQLRFAF
ncbi:MAG TPA: helix-hairpin-helix domain-containing protein [Saprospiraceae bacterium]|nr:helix-hairpin-helix domain-containing protein [Saprospiraceae bacterium]